MDDKLIEEIKNGEIYRLSKRFRDLPSFKHNMSSFIYSGSSHSGRYKTPLEYACEALCLESIVFLVERWHPVNFSYYNRSMSLLGIVLCAARNYNHTSIEDLKKAYFIIRYLRKNGYQLELPTRGHYNTTCKNGCFYFEAINISFEHVCTRYGNDLDINVDKNLIIANILIQLVKMGLDPCANCCHRSSFIDRHREEMNHQIRNYHGYTDAYGGNHAARFLIEYAGWDREWKDISKNWTLFQMMLPIIIKKDEKYRFFKYNINGFRNSMRSIRSISFNKKQRVY